MNRTDIPPDMENIPPKTLHLLLDTLIEVMQTGDGALLSDKNSSLPFHNIEGIKEHIIEKARIRLGACVHDEKNLSGIFLKGLQPDRRQTKDLGEYDPGDTPHIFPITGHEQTIGRFELNTDHPDHGLLVDRKKILQGVLNRFFEYILQVKLPDDDHDTSNLYMMNIFREYNTIRELRLIFDYLFHLTCRLLDIGGGKGVFVLNDSDTGRYDLVLGYGFETGQYRMIYEELLPQIKSSPAHSSGDILIRHREAFTFSRDRFLSENHFVQIPIAKKDRILAQILIFTDPLPKMDETSDQTIHSACDVAADILNKTISGRWLHDLTYTDSLTGTYHYGLWWRRLHEEVGRARRRGNEPISLFLFDVDHFNRFNESNGYFIGDQLLRVIADRIKACTRNIDVVGRIGGEEFGVVLPGAGKKDAMKVADRILAGVSEIPSRLRIRIEHPLTLSGGMAAFPEDADEPTTLVENAKTALVSAKIMGGARIISFDDLEE